MRKFEIEHIGICVEKPIEMAKWYHETLGFNIKFCGEDEEKGWRSSRTAATGSCWSSERSRMSGHLPRG